MGNFLGVDCGGTSLRAGLVSKEGQLIKQWKIPSPLKTNPQSFAENLKGIVGEEQFDGIGIGVPGPLDLEKGLILPSSNLGNKEPLEIVDQVRAAFDSKAKFATNIQFDRDTIVALIGEAWKGGAQGLKDVVMLTLGTGVGGAVMVDGEIDYGQGKAGEIGHIIIDTESNKECGLGHKGCLEAMINGTKAQDEMATYLGVALANIVDILNPEKIIIGGGKTIHSMDRPERPEGVEGSKIDFLPQAIEVMKEKGIKPAVDELIVEYAKLGEWSGVYGAARLAIMTGSSQHKEQLDR